MKIEDAVVLITGATRGIGLAFARESLARGARKVQAGARDPATITQIRVQPLRLDVNKPEDVAAAAAMASDVTLVINNAGIAQPGGFLAADSEEVARRIKQHMALTDQYDTVCATATLVGDDNVSLQLAIR